MGYRHPILEPGADARRDLLAAAVVLGAHLDAPEGESTTSCSSERCARSWTHASATSHRSARVTASRSIARRHPRTPATACARSCVASA
jgi:hypothetical protein